MIPKVIWCLFSILLYIFNEVQSSTTEQDGDVFTTVLSTNPRTQRQAFGDKILDSVTTNQYSEPYGEDAELTTGTQVQTAEVNTYSDPYGGYTEFTTENAALYGPSSEDPEGPPDHVIPYSEHETPEDVPTRPKYSVPGAWAKPPPGKNISLEFVPTKTYAQVRGTHSVKHLPQSEAVAAATTDEEVANAPRLKEVVSKTKVNTVYSEEGYEDSAYDHAGHIRDADFHEGYAKKLHDERDSRQGAGKPRNRNNGMKKKKKKNKAKYRVEKPNHEEFDEFADDYSDHSAGEAYESESTSNEEKKDQNRIYKEMWKKPEINPKKVTENEIDKLERDLRKEEEEEAEKGSENDEFSREREAEENYDPETTEERTVTLRPGKSKSRSRNNIDSVAKPRREYERTTKLPTSTTKEKFYKEKYEATTIQFEMPTTPKEFDKFEASTSRYQNPATNGYIAQTTVLPDVNYDPSTPSANNDPTTINYSQQFWQYFKSRPTETTTPQVYPRDQTTIQQPLLIQDTTIQPIIEHQTPVALATINGHGPYLLVTSNEESTQSSIGFETGTVQPVNSAYGFINNMQNVQYIGNGQQNILPFNNAQPGIVSGQIQNGRQYYDPNMIPNDQRYFGNDRVAGPQSGPYGPSFLQANGPARSVYEAWRSNNGEYNAQEMPAISTEPSRFLDSAAYGSTPTYSVISPPSGGFQSHERASRKQSKYQNNPFLNSRGNSSVERSLNQEDSDSEETFFKYKPNSNYEKILNYIKNEKDSQSKDRDSVKFQQIGGFDEQNGESGDLEDFTIMRPPALGKTTFFDFPLNSYANVVDHSSVAQESETMEEAGPKKSDENAKRYNKDILGSLETQRDQSATLNARQSSFPASNLLPPAPNSKDEYAAHGSVNRGTDYHKPSRHSNRKHNQKFGQIVRSYSPDPEQLAQYLNHRKLQGRYKRSLEEAAFDEEKIADVVIAQEISKRFPEDVSNDTSEPVEAKSRSKRSLIPEENLQLKEDNSKGDQNVAIRNRRSSEDLLEASHKIAGDVIDEEIKARFENKGNGDDDDEDDEESEEIGERQVEAEVPDFDYLEEIQDVNHIEIPTTTEATIDLEKYPFYRKGKFSSSSPLKYITNPREVPRKTHGGMEFYDSRDKYMQCDEVDPDLEQVVPDDEEPVPNRGPKHNLPRLRGLGNKLDCFKSKYFDENPFDNPLFFEKQVAQPTPPSELDPIKFASRISELPKESKGYVIQAQSKRPESLGRRMKRPTPNYRPNSYNSAETVNVKFVTDPQTGSGRNVIRSEKIRSSTERPAKRRRTRGRRPTTRPTQAATEAPKRGRPTTRPMQTSTEIPIANPVTPYQKEVYDDVMGTIKNLASLYEMFGAHTAIPLIEATTSAPREQTVETGVTVPSDKPLNHIPTSVRGKQTGFPLLDISERPRSEEIEGLMPPPKLAKNIKILLPYRTNRVSYKTRVRTESPLESSDKKIIGYFKTVTVHRRSIDADNNSNRKENIEFLKHSVSKRSVDASSTTSRPVRGRRRKLNSATTTTIASPNDTKTESKEGAPKVVYTIRSRTRNTKSEKDTGKNGNFTTTEKLSTTTDSRRNEPRYNRINRRKGIRTSTTTVAPTTAEGAASSLDTTIRPIADSLMETTSLKPELNETIIEEIYKTEHSTPHKTKVNFKNTDPYYEPEHIEEDDEEHENYEEKVPTDDNEEQKVGIYDVHEDIQEVSTEATIGVREPVKTDEYSELESYLQSDPPGYAEAFSSEDGQGKEKEGYRNEESNVEEVEEEEDHEESPKDSYRKDDSDDSEGDVTDSPRQSESYKDPAKENNDDSNSQEKTNTGHDDDNEKTFFRYNSRPVSSYENYEDDKYSDLGPRINKPAFHHPPFKAPKYERASYGNLEEESEEDERDETEESEEKEKYVFPWVHDEEDEKEDFYARTTERYEYPWDKRERLERERNKRRKEAEKLRKLKDFSFFHEDDDDDDDDFEEDKKSSSSESRDKYVYPWDRYDMPSRRKKNGKKNYWGTNIFDSDEVSSEQRPVAKFSSRYSNSKFNLPLGVFISTTEPGNITESVTKFMEDEATATFEPTTDDESKIFATNEPVKLTELSTSATINTTPRTEFTTPSVPIFRTNKKVAKAKITPKDITTSPKKRGRGRTNSRTDRTTVKPSVINPSEATITSKEGQTARNNRTKKIMRPKVKVDKTRKENVTKAESQIALTTEQPTQSVTTVQKTESSTLTKSPEILTVRRRGKIIKPDKSEKDSKKKTSVDGGGSSKSISRRRTRPTVTTVSSISPIANKKEDEPVESVRNGRTNSRSVEKSDHWIPTASSINTEDAFVNSTPTSRTVEHRSRVSKEEIITKTSFPDQDATYKTYKDKDIAKKINQLAEESSGESATTLKPKRAYSNTPQRARGSLTEQLSPEDEHPIKNESVEKVSIITKETPDHVYQTKKVDKDGVKGTFISIVPNNQTMAPSSLGEKLKNAEMEELERRKEGYDTYDKIRTESGGDDDGYDEAGSVLSEDSYILGNMLKNIPPRSNHLEEVDDDDEEDSSAEVSDYHTEDDEMEESEETDEDGERPQAKYIKDPSQRLYYYAEDGR